MLVSVPLTDLDDEALEPAEKFAAAAETALEKAQRTRVFLAERFPPWLSVAGYGVLCVTGSVFIPMLYPQITWWVAVHVCVVW